MKQCGQVSSATDCNHPAYKKTVTDTLTQTLTLTSMYGNKVYKKLLGELISTKATLREGQDTQIQHS